MFNKICDNKMYTAHYKSSRNCRRKNRINYCQKWKRIEQDKVQQSFCRRKGACWEMIEQIAVGTRTS